MGAPEVIPPKFDIVGFLFKLTTIVLLAVGGYLIMTSEWGEPDQYQLQAEDFILQLKPLPASKLQGFLKEKGKPSVIMFYASWCSTCRGLLPKILAEKENRLKGSRVEFLSLDERTYALARYIVANKHEGQYTPYIIRPDAPIDLRAMIGEMGGKFQGAIPFVAIFDKHGRLAASGTGAEYFEQYITTAQDLLKE